MGLNKNIIIIFTYSILCLAEPTDFVPPKKQRRVVNAMTLKIQSFILFGVSRFFCLFVRNNLWGNQTDINIPECKDTKKSLLHGERDQQWDVSYRLNRSNFYVFGEKSEILFYIFNPYFINHLIQHSVTRCYSSN